MIMSRPVIIIGAGGHASVLIATLSAAQREIIGILHPDAGLIGRTFEGIRIIGDDDKVADFVPGSLELVNGIGSISSTGKRKNIYTKFKNRGYLFASIIHPDAMLMKDVMLGEGVQIMMGAIVQKGCQIGHNSIINTGAVIDHDCVIGAHAHVAPGAVLSGGVQIDDMVHVGTSATVIQGVKIGAGALVGAGAVVLRDVPSGVKAMGVPARIVE
jgi:sugar O-acyltransferase (sialic acid O-acetyltransferase NeuD family)